MVSRKKVEEFFVYVHQGDFFQVPKENIMEFDDGWVIAKVGTGPFDSSCPLPEETILTHTHKEFISTIDKEVSTLYPVAVNMAGDLYWCPKCEETIPKDIETAYNLLTIGG